MSNIKLRELQELNDLNTSSWTEAELHHHQRIMFDLSPWLNAQGTAMLGQIIQEIVRRD